MEQQRDDTDRVTLTMDEYELHNWLCGLRQVISRELGIDDEHYLERIVITPQHPELCTPELQKKWEYMINQFLRECQQLDGSLHDDMEYTC